jgi:hypothetical protein
MERPKDEIEKLKKRYVGRKVYAGCEMDEDGYYGTIVDIVPDEDGWSPWFMVRDDDDPEHIEKWDKGELRTVRMRPTLEALD